MLGLHRKLWIKLANHQLEKRLNAFGEKANTCKGCLEILICDGPVSFQICQEVDNLIGEGFLNGPKKIYPFERIRRKFLLVSEECLNAYGMKINLGKLEIRKEGAKC